MSFNSRDFKGFTFRSGPVKNQVKQNSTFWDTNSNDVDVDEFLGLDTNISKGKDLVVFDGYKGISNFVNIVTEDNIPVVFNSNDQSYTDGKKVVIGSNIDDKKFDVAVGLLPFTRVLILRCLISIYLTLRNFNPQEIYEVVEKINVDRYTVISTVKSILNYVEDRRIDSFIFRTSPATKIIIATCMTSIFILRMLTKVCCLLNTELKRLILICSESLTFITRTDN